MARGPIRKYPIGPIVNALGGEVGNYRTGKQKIKCINPGHDDSRPSAVVDFSGNRYRCFACGLGGDGLDLIVILEGVGLSAAVDRAEAITGGPSDAARPAQVETASLFDRPRAGRGGG